MSVTVTIPVSAGELYDRLSILVLKAEAMGAGGRADALANVLAEQALLAHIAESAVESRLNAHDHGMLSGLRDRLYLANAALWRIEDDVRACEAKQDFGPDFVRLARAVYHTNDQRCRIKREIDTLTGSAVKEEKLYTSY